MISTMKRAIGLAALLGVAIGVAARPARAQNAADETDDSWFDEASAESAPRPAAPSDSPAGYGPSSAPEQSPPNDFSPADSARPPSAPPGSAENFGDNQSETDPRALSQFRPALDPYGSWIEDDKYGTVWVPNRDAVGEDFAPYVSAGRWALTDDDDWAWQSDYPFGGVVFHYGRWVWLSGTGWAWVAGNRYANAWVSWRVPTDDYGYVGWAPIPPAWGWYGGSAVSLGSYPPSAFVFCPSSYAFSPHVHSYIVHDRYVMRDVAAHTRNYSDGGRGHSPASPRVVAANSRPSRGPSLESAHVPAAVAPISRLPARSTFAGERSRIFGSANASDQRYSSDRAASPRFNPTAVDRAAFSAPGSRSTSYRAARYANTGEGQRSPYFPPPSARAESRPSYAESNARYYAAPSPRSLPARESAVPGYRSASPSFHYSAPTTRSYAPPATHYSAPTPHYSAPAVHYSAPSFQSPAFHAAPSPSFHMPSRR